MQLIYLLLFLYVFELSASPRLLITANQNLPIDQLQEKLSALFITGTDEEIQTKIKDLDRSTDNHILILEHALNNMYWTCRRLGYAYIHLSEDFDLSLLQVNAMLANLPSTSKDLPHMEPLEVGKLYDLLIKVDCIFRKANLSYWATCGTLLGAVRHQGIIPWDDDIDLAILAEDISLLLSLEENFLEEGLSIVYHPKFKFYKISPFNGKTIMDDQGNPYPWTFPFIDIFPQVKKNNRFEYAYQPWVEACPHDFFLDKDLLAPLPELIFGPLSIPVPHDYLERVQAIYGEEWNDVAYADYSHRLEQRLLKVKVNLVDRAPPPYILPE